MLNQLAYILILLTGCAVTQAAELLQFLRQACQPDNTVHLVWSVDDESGIVGFELERSAD